MGGIVTSYDIGFKVKVEGVDYWVEPMDCDANVTWNVREIIEKSTGLDWLNEANNGLCTDVIPYIEHGVKELTEHPDKYKKYEPKNRWGTVSSTRMFFQTILQDWERFKSWYPELAPIATFWIY